MRYENRANRTVLAPDRSPTAQRITRAARALYLEKGIGNVTTREIAAKADVNLGLIPYYFGSKKNLANVVYRQMKSETYQSILREIALDDLPAAERLYIYTMLRWDACASSPEAELMHEYLVSGEKEIKEGQTTYFKSVGMGLFDVCIEQKLYEVAKEK